MDHAFWRYFCLAWVWCGWRSYVSGWHSASGVRAFQLVWCGGCPCVSVGVVRVVFVRFSLARCGGYPCVSAWRGAVDIRAFQSQMAGSAVKTPLILPGGSAAASLRRKLYSTPHHPRLHVSVVRNIVRAACGCTTHRLYPHPDPLPEMN